MPFPMKIQPIDIDSEAVREPVRIDSAAKPVLKSRLRRLFDRRFPSVLRISSTEKPTVAGGDFNKDGGGGGGAIVEFEPSSVCLAKMVQNFLEETNEKQQATKCGGIAAIALTETTMTAPTTSSTSSAASPSPPAVPLAATPPISSKSLIPCASVHERKPLSRRSQNRRDEQASPNRKTSSERSSPMASRLSATTPPSANPSGTNHRLFLPWRRDRLLIDIDFRSEFEVARPTGAYKAVLQSLPFIFVGKSDRLPGQIVSIVTGGEAEPQEERNAVSAVAETGNTSGAKWLSPCTTRTTISQLRNDVVAPAPENGTVVVSDDLSECGELELIFGEDAVNSTDPSPEVEAKVTGNSVAVAWQPPAVKPKSVERGARIVTGLASLLAAKP
ncbi:hypothetical protein J5N97_000454 [Dioscorea zingiberensis]|uniref:Uncharacterized protein n=1 Tax=Dioscorea zingiberensis TaxID=325984 RepID=A0A9D5BSG0_9LILI|nr:hypothetical protein J5N97_000454 [Dioscorea zingiberensis]